jgi:RNA polymerase sigma-70 factor (ECF subfamily)
MFATVRIMVRVSKQLFLKESPTYDEQACLLQVAQGDEQAFAKIMDRYTRIIFPHLLSYLKQPQKAEELTQDIFMRIWHNREKLPSIDNFPGYVYVITRNRVNTALREKLADLAQGHLDGLQQLLTQPESSLELKDLIGVLNKAIEALPARRQEVFRLSRIENLTYEQIAERLGISRSAVRQHIVEALVFLRNYLREQLGIVIPGLLWMVFSQL